MKQFVQSLVLALVISLVTTPSSAQSLFNAAGMGLPVEAIERSGTWGSDFGEVVCYPVIPRRRECSLRRRRSSWVSRRG